MLRPADPLPRVGALPLLLAACLALPGPSAAQEGGGGVTAFQAGRVERALENRLACRGCHRIAGRGGLIGPVLDGMADRAEPEYVASMIRNPATTVPGTLMPRQPMPEREVRRLAAYLMSLPPVQATGTAQAAVALPPGAELDGAALYARHCAACHGDGGRGDGWNVPNLGVVPAVHADPEAMGARPDDTLYDGIAAGGFVLDRSPLMPAFGELLTPEQIRALVAHIRTLCACEQPAWAGAGR
jgi:mono/diheme cytochrome c family protein